MKPLTAWRLAVPLLAASLFAACAPAPGGPCSRAGFICDDAATALECRGGKWREVPCRGPRGCAQTAEVVTCDTTLNQSGDGCASAEEGRGQCSGDGTAVYECRDGSFVETRRCQSCTVSSGLVVCQP